MKKEYYVGKKYIYTTFAGSQRKKNIAKIQLNLCFSLTRAQTRSTWTMKRKWKRKETWHLHTWMVYCVQSWMCVLSWLQSTINNKTNICWAFRASRQPALVCVCVCASCACVLIKVKRWHGSGSKFHFLHHHITWWQPTAYHTVLHLPFIFPSDIFIYVLYMLCHLFDCQHGRHCSAWRTDYRWMHLVFCAGKMKNHPLWRQQTGGKQMESEYLHTFILFNSRNKNVGTKDKCGWFGLLNRLATGCYARTLIWPANARIDSRVSAG